MSNITQILVLCQVDILSISLEYASVIDMFSEDWLFAFKLYPLDCIVIEVNVVQCMISWQSIDNMTVCWTNCMPTLLR